MKKVIFMVFLILVAFNFMYAGQPKLKEAKIEPQSVTSGEKAKISVAFTGSKKDIKEVYFVVREYVDEAPLYSLAPDATSKDNLWILEETVPYDAPVGEMHLDITAVDKDGKKIVTKGLDKEALGTTASLKLDVKY